MAPLSFDLLFAIRETQLQHGLRADDFGKYHRYLTGRIKTLRKQLKLAVPHPTPPSIKGGARNKGAAGKKDAGGAAAAASSSAGSAAAGAGGKKSTNNGAYDKSNPLSRATYVPPKQVTEALAASDERAVMLLALLCERSWAESEELNHAAASAGSELMLRHQGSAALTRRHGRARLASTEAHLERLVKIADAVGDEGLQRQARAYAQSMRGRNCFAHGRMEEAKAAFLDARQLLHRLVLDASVTVDAVSSAAAATAASATATRAEKKRDHDRAQSAAAAQTVVVELRTECDDRIVTCMRRLGEDPAAYKPSTDTSARVAAATAALTSGAAGGVLSWLGRSLPAVSQFFQVQNAYRRFEAIAAFESAGALLKAATQIEDANGLDGMCWWIFQQQSAFNKQNENFDRAVGALNDALDAVAAQITAVSGGVGGGGGGASSEIVNQLRLAQHCLRFRSLMCAVLRAYFAAWSLGARFLLGQELLLLGSAAGTGAAQRGGKASRLPSKTLVGIPAGGFPGIPASGTNNNSSNSNSGKKELSFTAQHVVSPADVVRLFDVVGANLEEAMLLPGVEDEGVAIQVLAQRIEADRLFFIAKAWEVVAAAVTARSPSATKNGSVEKNAAEAAAALERCLSLLGASAASLSLKKVKLADDSGVAAEWAKRYGFACPVFAFPQAQLERRAMSARTVASALAAAPPQLAAATAPVELVASRSNAAAGAGGKKGAIVAAADRLDEPVVCNAFSQFPPDFQAVPCKPAFVDIAGTYADDFTTDVYEAYEHPQATKPATTAAAAATKKADEKQPAATSAAAAAAPAQQQQQQPQQGGGSWFSWLRGGQ